MPKPMVQLSLTNFHFVKPDLLKHVLLVWTGLRSGYSISCTLLIILEGFCPPKMMACCHILLSTPLGYRRSHDRSRRVALLNPSQKISSFYFVPVSMKKRVRTSIFFLFWRHWKACTIKTVKVYYEPRIPWNWRTNCVCANNVCLNITFL